MEARRRSNPKFVYLSDKELELVHKKMEVGNAKNFSVYARKMLVDGLLINKQFSDMKDLIEQLARIGNNINQVARVANQTNAVTKEDINIIQKNYQTLSEELNKALLKIVYEDRREF